MKKDKEKIMRKEERKKLEAELTTTVQGILSKQNIPAADKVGKLVKDHVKVIAKKFTKAAKVLSEAPVVEKKSNGVRKSSTTKRTVIKNKK